MAYGSEHSTGTQKWNISLLSAKAEFIFKMCPFCSRSNWHKAIGDRMAFPVA